MPLPPSEFLAADREEQFMAGMAARVNQELEEVSLTAGVAPAGNRTAVVIKLPDGTNAVLGADGTTYVSWIAGVGPTRSPLSDDLDEVASRFAARAMGYADNLKDA